MSSSQMDPQKAETVLSNSAEPAAIRTDLEDVLAPVKPPTSAEVPTGDRESAKSPAIITNPPPNRPTSDPSSPPPKSSISLNTTSTEISNLSLMSPLQSASPSVPGRPEAKTLDGDLWVKLEENKSPSIARPQGEKGNRAFSPGKLEGNSGGTSPKRPPASQKPQVPPVPPQDLQVPVDPDPRLVTPVTKPLNPESEGDTYDPPSRTPVYPRVTGSSQKGSAASPKALALDQTPISLINDQHEVELLPRRHSADKRGSNLGDVQDTVTITKVAKRSKGADRPKTPVLRPRTPAERAKTPVLRPRTPADRPKTPVLRPRTPVDRPKTPVTRSKTPIERPMTPVDRPATPGVKTDMRRRRRRNSRDEFCWKCHKDEVEIACSTCVRSWHKKCIGGGPPSSPSDWICGECASILKAENASTRSPLMFNLTMDQLCMVLKHIILKMKRVTGSEEFSTPVDLTDITNYLDYIVKPMDLTLLETNIRSKEYGSPDAFMADAKWILHNCLVYNTEGGKYTDTSKLTTVAKGLIKVAREELSELESCPTCYIRGRHLGRPHYTWFSDSCKPPHLLVWAKLKGFPYWPAKIMPRWNQQGFVDVRFFGEHNRAWVSPKDIYLYSKEPPTATPKSKKEDIAECLREISIHIKRLSETFGRFEHAPPKTSFNPFDSHQITMLLPDYEPPAGDYYRLPKRRPIRGKKRRWDLTGDTSSEAYFHSDAETLADFNEGEDDEDEEVKGRETPRMRGSRRPETPGLPEASIPGKRSGTSISRTLPLKRNSRGSAGVRRGERRRTTGDIEREEDERVRPTRQMPERLNREGVVINKRPREPSTSGRSQEDSKEEGEEKGKADEVVRHRAKKSFPNKPPAMGGGKEGGLTTMKMEGSWWGAPAEAGPLSAILNRGADTLAKQMAVIIEEGIKMAAQGKGVLAGGVSMEQALAFDMKLRMERMKWEHEQEIAEVKRNSEKEWKELKTAIEAEHLRSIEEIQQSAELEKNRCIRATKQKQWCNSCQKESCMYCCWNTSYCSESCQIKDWGQHQNKCKRKNREGANKASKAPVTGGNRVNGDKEQPEVVSKGISGQSNFSYSRGA
ncbi:MYND-type zinc finger-containing chromatin reader ZMYND8 [Diachasmimorpha longicaudata]|uniref:MYND-type zinc finger-containing chromatin reader ZMYND8 n=1 Tax=Diachasmimorpha longicaudata TaxID=58733 RepID=UPI0030B87077